MLKRLLPIVAALALSAPLYARDAADPNCPQAERAVEVTPDIVCVGRTGEGYGYAFLYPRSAAAVPALEQLLRAESDRALAWIDTVAREYRAERATQGGEVHELNFEAQWEIDAALPELAAASGAISHYTGGAHGGIGYKVILLDRRGDRQIALADIFEPGFFEPDLLGYRLWGIRAVQAAFCRALTAEVRARREDPAAAVECPAVETQPVTFLCGAGGRIDRMRALLEPYAVGSWAEGPYEVDFPVDAAMMSAIKRRFRPAFGLTQETRPRSPARPCR